MNERVLARGIHDSVLFEHDTDILRQMWDGTIGLHTWDCGPADAPPAGIIDGVRPEVYHEYRCGRDSACVDIVVATRKPDGQCAVMLSLRKPDVCFGNTWWIYGGALLSYESIAYFIAARAHKECGVTVSPKVLLGVYRTCAPDNIGSTLQPCYGGFVEHDAANKRLSDEGHNAIKLFTLEELGQIPVEQQHWYPMRVSRLLLKVLSSQD